MNLPNFFKLKFQKIKSIQKKKQYLAVHKILRSINIDLNSLYYDENGRPLLKNGDYNMAERAFREFVNTNPDHKLAGNAQYWYAETFRIRQLFTDAASAYLEGPAGTSQVATSSE